VQSNLCLEAFSLFKTLTHLSFFFFFFFGLLTSMIPNVCMYYGGKKSNQISLEWDIPKVTKIAENDKFESVWTSCKNGFCKTNVSACPMPKAGTGSACFWECPTLGMSPYTKSNPKILFVWEGKKKKKRKVFPTNLSWSRHNQLDNLSAFVFMDFSKTPWANMLQKSPA
jgi:hypothetical protein